MVPLGPAPLGSPVLFSTRTFVVCATLVTMSNDTRWVVGTGVAIVTAILGTGGVLAGLLVTQMGAVHARLDGLDDRLRAVEIGFG